MSASSTRWDTFQCDTADVNSQQAFYRKAGSGPPILLIHGHPQTSHIWRFTAPQLAQKHTVVCADIRGYGQTSKPKGSDSHVEYSKREMAKDLVELMKSLGYNKFDVLAHDRGARIAHRLVLDYPEIVTNMCLLDIAPTLYMYEETNMQFAMGYWHWFFLPQPYPLPEEVMLADPEKFWNLLAGRASHKGVKWDAEDIAEYKKWYFTPEGVHGACEDYRAAATIDLEHDRESLAQGKLIGIKKLKILWGKSGMIEKYNDPVGIWKKYSKDGVQVDGMALPSGHYIPEHASEELLEQLRGFFD